MPNQILLQQTQKDAEDLNRLGYVQELFREMGGFSNFAISFSVISILTGAIQLYGYGLKYGGPLQMSAGWLVVSLFTLLISLSMAELASSYPTSGALYHWSSFLGGRACGWFTACFGTIGQFAILAGIDYGLAQLILGLAEGSNVPLWHLNTLYLLLLFSHALLNHLGIRVVTLLNNFSAWYHVAIVLILLLALFSKGLAQPASFMFTFHADEKYSPPYNFLIGLLLAQWTFTGYDAAAHVSEETIDPRKNAPRGIVSAVVLSIIFGLAMLLVVTLSIPNLDQAIAFGDNAFGEILKLRLGQSFGSLLAASILVAMWFCGLSTLTSASRSVFAFARDGGLPKSRFLSAISPKYKTPAHAIWALAVLSGFLAVSVSAEAAVTSVAVVALYVSYGLPIAARVYTRWKGRADERGPWDLGRWSNPIAIIGLSWICFISVLFIIPPNEIAGKVLGSLLVIVLALWFTVAKKKFKGPAYAKKKSR